MRITLQILHYCAYVLREILTGGLILTLINYNCIIKYAIVINTECFHWEYNYDLRIKSKHF